MKPYHVIVIGAGSTGSALAHDLSLRGLHVTVIDRAGIASGTTGHNQGQLHSGARYVTNDPDIARECIQENIILRRIVPGVLELNEGLFVGFTDEHLSFLPSFLDGCRQCGIPTQEIPIARALQIEPNLDSNLKVAIQVPDGVFDPYRLCLSFLATAKKNGTEVFTYTRMVGMNVPERSVTVRQLNNGKEFQIKGDLIINAAGPWAGEVARFANVNLDIEASAGVEVILEGRICQHVLNLLVPPGDGDIIVPLRKTSVLGTTSWKVQNPDQIPIPADHIERILSSASQMVPLVYKREVIGLNASARPLLSLPGRGGRLSSRGFACLDHAGEGAEGFLSVIGGKTITSRLMAEKAGDLVCQKLGIEAECHTRTEPLLSHRLGL
jgi:glycerol-3-phosphate dehydrogenase